MVLRRDVLQRLEARQELRELLVADLQLILRLHQRVGSRTCAEFRPATRAGASGGLGVGRLGPPAAGAAAAAAGLATRQRRPAPTIGETLAHRRFMRPTSRALPAAAAAARAARRRSGARPHARRCRAAPAPPRAPFPDPPDRSGSPPASATHRRPTTSLSSSAGSARVARPTPAAAPGAARAPARAGSTATAISTRCRDDHARQRHHARARRHDAARTAPALRAPPRPRRAPAPTDDPRTAATARARRPPARPTSSRADRAAARGTARTRPGAAPTTSGRVPSAMSTSSSAFRCMHSTVVLPPSSFFRLPERVKEIRLHRADRAAEHVGDFLMRHLVIRPQDQRRALLPRQLRDGRAHARRPLVLQQSLRRRLGARVDELLLLDRLGQLAQRRLAR